MAELTEVLEEVWGQGVAERRYEEGRRLLVMFVHAKDGNAVTAVLSSLPQVNAIVVATESRQFQTFGVPAVSEFDSQRMAKLLQFSSRCTEVRLPVSQAVKRFANPPDIVVFCDVPQADEIAVVAGAYPRARLVCPCDDGFELVV